MSRACWRWRWRDAAALSRADGIHRAQLMRCDHPLAVRESVSLGDLLRWPVAMHNQGVTIRQLFDIACGLEGLIFEPVFVSNYHVVLKRFVCPIDAITFIGFLTVRGRLEAEGFAAVPLTNLELHQRTLQIQTMAGRTLPQTMQAFLDLLTRAIDDESVVPD